MSELKRTLIEDVFYPVHEPRKASSLYRKTHKKLIQEMDEPCWICGIRHSDVVKMSLEDQRKFQMETHHAQLEWAASAAFDSSNPEQPYAKEMLAKLTEDHKEIMGDPLRLREWLDSEGNMLVLCARHHRSQFYGIHSVSFPVWILQRYQVDGGFQFIK